MVNQACTMITYLYTVTPSGSTVRVRYDLARRVEVGEREPWTEPPSKVNDAPCRMPQILYRCERERSNTRERVRRYRARKA